MKMRNPKSSDDIFLQKPPSIHISDIHQWLNFNLFSEVINADQEPLPIPRCLREGPHYIQSPLSKMPGTRQRIEDTP